MTRFDLKLRTPVAVRRSRPARSFLQVTRSFHTLSSTFVSSAVSIKLES